jgi:hypothetical protein
MSPSDREDWDNDLAAMAADPEIQRELRQIEKEFRPTEADGLENGACGEDHGPETTTES